MMNYYLESVLNELNKDERIKDIEGKAKSFDRAIYINGSEYQEYYIEVSFLVNTGDIFKSTIGFTMKINTFSRSLSVEKHFISSKYEFDRKQPKKVAEYIISEILTLKNKNQTLKSVSNI